MFRDDEYETALNKVLNELLRLDAEVLKLMVKKSEGILEANDVARLQGEYRSEIGALINKHKKLIYEGIDEYWSLIEPNYLKDDINTLQEAYNSGVLLYAPVVSQVSRDLIDKAITYDKSFYLNIINQIQANSQILVNNLVKKYAELRYIDNEPTTELIQRLARDLQKSNVTVTSISGKRKYKDLVSYSRMVLKQTSNNTFIAVKDQLARDVGIPDEERKVIVSRHTGARPKHAKWQGKVFKFVDLAAKTGYGSPGGLLGVNCRHKYYTWIDGVSSNDFPEVEVAENDRIYKAQQKLRYFEGKIREYKRKEMVDLQLGNETSPNTNKRKYWQGQANSLCKAEGIKRHYQYERVA